MKRAISLTALAMLAASPALAGNPLIPDDPEVLAPVPTWTGPYVGGMVGYHKSRTTKTITNVDPVYDTIDCDKPRGCDPWVPDHLLGNADIQALPTKGRDNCGHMTYDCITKFNSVGQAKRLWIRDDLTVQTGTKTTTTTVKETHEEGAAGIFAGYRHSFGGGGGIVLGAEAFAAQTFDTGETLVGAEAQFGFDAGRCLPYASAGGGSFGGDGGAIYGGGIDCRINHSWMAGLKYQHGDFGDTETDFVSLRVGYNF